MFSFPRSDPIAHSLSIRSSPLCMGVSGRSLTLLEKSLHCRPYASHLIIIVVSHFLDSTFRIRVLVQKLTHKFFLYSAQVRTYIFNRDHQCHIHRKSRCVSPDPAHPLYRLGFVTSFSVASGMIISDYRFLDHNPRLPTPPISQGFGSGPTPWVVSLPG